mgnify:FL=1
MGHAPFAHSICCMDHLQFELKEACSIPRRFWVQPKTSMLLYPTLFRSKRESRHFTFISYHWFSGGSMVTDDEKEPYCGLCIVQATLTEARCLIVVMTFNDDSSASRPPPSSPSIPSKCVRQFMSHILLSAEMHTSPRAWRTSPARRRARAAASATCRRRARART